ncbi:MAG: hypothetical protein RMI91_11145 [Gemmatales bacterium]|nr:hypothetical protein [Gemmatales bacterium]MDW7995199.1 hypothetical protein [Gemmatales bacterium]
MANKTFATGKSALVALASLLLFTVLGCHHYVCDGCGGCGSSCAGAQVYVVPTAENPLMAPTAEPVRKLPSPAP